MRNSLLIFIDGFQYDEAVTRLSILRNARLSRVTPGFGFSNNIYPEMLCGTDPDEIGYFNEWSPKHDMEMGHASLLFNMLDLCRNNLYINAGIRSVIFNKIFKKKYCNIPFKYVNYFEPHGSHQFKDLGKQSLLYKYNLEIVDSVDFKRNRRMLDSRDKKSLKKIFTMDLRNKNIFLSLVELDNICHRYGIGSNEYSLHIEYLDKNLGRVIDSFKKANNECQIYLFSDHGMVNVTKKAEIELEKIVGDAVPDRYLYFLDSTFLRVWIKEPALYRKIFDYLKDIYDGEILSEQEREIFGVKNKAFGDIIFRAKEGVLFFPNFFGARMVKAMHGYNSDLRSQQAFFSQISGDSDASDLPRRSKEIYKFLSKQLAN